MVINLKDSRSWARFCPKSKILIKGNVSVVVYMYNHALGVLMAWSLKRELTQKPKEGIWG